MLTDFPTVEVDLMRRVARLAGPYLAEIAPKITIPAAFLAALTANESGRWLISNTQVPARRENHVLEALRRVQIGLRGRYGQITQPMLTGKSEGDLGHLASSYGLTQIMGWHTLLWPEVEIADLADAARHYYYTLRLLVEEARRCDLDLTQDFAAMFRVWNTGATHDDPRTPRVEGKTFDPDYVPNGLRRMRIWEELASSSSMHFQRAG
jgi:hypothetical protein